MRINVFGLGYVGCVSVACFAHEGHDVTGVDISDTKVDMINKGRPTVIEKELDTLIKEGWEEGRIRATKNHMEAVNNSDISIVCVGTPNSKSGHLNLEGILAVAKSIGEGLRGHNGFHTVMIRSTVLPGTNEKVGEVIARESGKQRGSDFEVVSNPEFLREGSAVFDFYHPPVTVVGTNSDRAFGIVRELYRNVQAPINKTDIYVAEVIKLINNSFHALKVSFANEVGTICKSLGIDSNKVMDLFCEDTKLNLSSYYLHPGFAYGGSCLPKDLKALTLLAHDNYTDIPLIESIDRSNQNQIKRLVEMIIDTGKKNVGVFGFSFKEGTDDLRNSPIVEVTETLIGKGFKIRIFDKNVHLSNLIGANKEYIHAKIPHLADLITNDMEYVARNCELAVIANKENGIGTIFDRYPDKKIIDLVGIPELSAKGYEGYEGFNW